MLSHSDLIKVLWVKVYTEGTIRLVGVCKGQYPFSRPRNRGYNALGDHVIEGALYLLSVLYGYPPLVILDWQDKRVGPDGICTGHVAYLLDEPGKAHFRAEMS